MDSIVLSLVQTSQNRLREVERFVHSLNNQVNIDFSRIQYIFVDQGNHFSAFENLNADINFKYIHCEKCSLSHARNLALPEVKGSYIAFPDDDCWYETDTLSKVLSLLERGTYDGLSGIGYNESGILTSTFPSKSKGITKNDLCAAISYTIFLRYERNVKFDENMGVGSPYNIGSGEESDYLLTLIEDYHYNIYYDTSVIIHHPAESDVVMNSNALLKAYRYARGDGYLFKKHKMPLYYILMSLVRPFAGMLFFVLTLRFYEAKRSYYRLRGRIEGLMFRL